MKPVRQHDLTDRWIEPGLFISFDNGDVGVVEPDGVGMQLLVSSDGETWYKHGHTTRSQHVMGCIIYTYPSDEL